jgi:hypothetical protein
MKAWARLLHWHRTAMHPDYSASPDARGPRGLIPSADRMMCFMNVKTREVVAVLQPAGSLLAITPLFAGVIEKVGFVCHMAMQAMRLGFIQHVVLNVDGAAAAAGATATQQLTAFT